MTQNCRKIAIKTIIKADQNMQEIISRGASCATTGGGPPKAMAKAQAKKETTRAPRAL
jgi:ribosomal protein L12E/L44/L45/RPP1/RPP2